MAKAKKATTTAAQETVTPAATGAAPAATVEPVQLTIADLQVLGRIIDLASRRGAFQAGELSQVGDAFNKLTGFLAYVESVQSKDKTGEEADAPAATEAAPAA